METPDALDKLSDRQERRGAKIFFRALKMQYTDLARQYEAGRELVPNTQIIKIALTGYYTKVQLEMAQWQYDDLQRNNPVKAFQMGTYERVLSLIRAWVTLNSGAYIKSISDTTLQEVKKVIAKGQTEGFGARKIGQLLRQEAKGPFTVYRSTVIARTEGTRAASQGAEFGANQWEQISGQKKWKAWSVQVDGRQRDSHEAMINSDPIPGDQDFVVGGKKMSGPGDPKGGKDNVIQCRCRKYYMSERVARQMIRGATPVPQAPKPVPARSDVTLFNEFDEFDEAEERELVLNKAAYTTERVKKDYAHKVPELDLSEVVAVNRYSGSDYSFMNKLLRDQDGFNSQGENTVKYFKALVNQANKGLNKMPKYKGLVYRGSPRLDDDILKGYEDAFKSGEPYMEKAFMSTSPELQSSFGISTIFEVQSKTGVFIKEISDHSHENEVLFKARTKFKVTGYDRIGNAIHIKMTEI